MTWDNIVVAAAGVQSRISSRIRRWPQDSPFAWMIPLAPVSKGRAGLMVVRELMHMNGYITRDAKGIAQSFITVKGVVKVKTSLLWDNGTFVFEQIEDDPYDFLAMLGLMHHDACFWLCTKKLALTNSHDQHKSQSRWLVFEPSCVPTWLSNHGGHIDMIADTLNNGFR